MFYINSASLSALIMTWGLLHYVVAYSNCFVRVDIQIIVHSLACESAEASGRRKKKKKAKHTNSCAISVNALGNY